MKAYRFFSTHLTAWLALFALLPATATLGAADATLTVDVLNTALYGYRFRSQNTHPERLDLEFEATGEDDLKVGYTGYDIDYASEVNIELNGTPLNGMAVTMNKRTGPGNLVLDKATIAAGTNTLSFIRSIPNYRWGITDIFLELVNRPAEISRLEAGIVDGSRYGYRFGEADGHPSMASFNFVGGQGPLLLTYRGYDIDVPNEVFIEVNGSRIGAMGVTPTNRLGAGEIMLPLAVQEIGDNELVFTRRVPGYRWGVTDLLLTNVQNGALGPIVDIDTPSAGAVHPSLGVITGTATDSANVDTVELVLQNLDTNQYWDGANYTPAFRPAYTAIRATLSGPTDARTWSHDFDFAIDGDYRLTILASDGDGNVTDPSPSIDFSIASVQPTGNQPNLSDYRIIFRDEFNGSELDSTKWRTSYYWGPYQLTNGESQLYVDTLGVNAGFEYDPFEFTGSTLKINAEPVGGSVQAPVQPGPNNAIWTADRYGRQADFGHKPDYDPAQVDYLSGVINTINTFDAAQGYFEARIKVPYGRGLWPAFWLLTKTYVEDVPEIDIMENLGQRPDRMHHMFHYFEPNNNWRLISTPEAPSLNADLSNGFHTYAAAWEPGQIVYYIDGVERRRVTSDDYSISKQAMYLLANLAVGGWPGDPDEPDSNGVFPASLEIDYIRAYEKKPPAKITPAVLQSEFQIMFSDEFDGGSPDASKWRTSYPWGPFFPVKGDNGLYDEEQYYVDWRGLDANMAQQPFSSDGGILSITAESIDPGDLPPQPADTAPIWDESRYKTYYNSPLYDNGGWVPSYTSGVIASRDEFNFINGYVEIRAKLPEGAGLWPALRLLSGYRTGPTPDIDIAMLKGDAPGTLHHGHSYGTSNGRVTFEDKTTGAGGQSFADGFHNYGVEWRRGLIKWYVDGEVVATLEDENVAGQLMYIEANLGVGGDFVGPTDPTVFPAAMQIDYVKAWQRKDIH